MFKRLATWSAIAALLAIAIARIAVWLQSLGFSTVVLFPLCVGSALGIAVAYIANLAGEKRRILMVLGAILAAVICAATEHGFFYLDYRRDFEAKLQSNPNAALVATANPDLVKPVAFEKFMSSSAAENWRLWIVDAVAMIGAAGVAAWFTYSILLAGLGTGAKH